MSVSSSVSCVYNNTATTSNDTNLCIHMGIDWKLGRMADGVLGSTLFEGNTRLLSSATRH
ncbi:hypothetical protein DPMN_057789 [Dreissena polymorpha]|uniref:Uncharacterized protein n=1 Tax=Dreissena polymorpha TaxID=45954 RepID=A0A9D4HET8_DREPO|nr:hypothetical protein DPMN_057789 [Dreissena polymorpha]